MFSYDFNGPYMCSVPLLALFCKNKSVGIPFNACDMAFLTN
jgi:hypothetical protein